MKKQKKLKRIPMENLTGYNDSFANLLCAFLTYLIE